VRPSAVFLGKFFPIAALLFALWARFGASDAYTRAVVSVGNPVIQAITGFRVTEFVPSDAGLKLRITRGSDTTIMQLNPREIFSGLIPFLALMGASVGLPWRQWTKAIAIGMGVLFVFHIGLLVFGPFFEGGPQGAMSKEWVHRVNTAVDVTYGFYGLIGYAALPFLLWFWLGRPRPMSGRL
jgi:hypothetical protein